MTIQCCLYHLYSTGDRFSAAIGVAGLDCLVSNTVLIENYCMSQFCSLVSAFSLPSNAMMSFLFFAQNYSELHLAGRSWRTVLRGI